MRPNHEEEVMMILFNKVKRILEVLDIEVNTLPEESVKSDLMNLWMRDFFYTPNSNGLDAMEFMDRNGDEWDVTSDYDVIRFLLTNLSDVAVILNVSPHFLKRGLIKTIIQTLVSLKVRLFLLNGLDAAEIFEGILFKEADNSFYVTDCSKVSPGPSAFRLVYFSLRDVVDVNLGDFIPTITLAKH